MKDLLKNIIPNWLKALVRKTVEYVLNSVFYSQNEASHKNFIVTFHKCGSQWFRTVFVSKKMHDASSYRFFTYRLLPFKGYDDRPLNERPINRISESSGIFGPLYTDRSGLDNVLEENDKVVVIIRDPRTVIPSWYDSVLKTHAKMGNVGELRSKIANSELAAGMDVMIDHAVSFGTFIAMESWMTAAETDSRIRIIRFEDIFSTDQEQEFVSLLNHFGLTFNMEKVRKVLDSNSFARMTKKNKHYKKGKNRSWTNKLTDLQVKRIVESCPKTMKLYELER